MRYYTGLPYQTLFIVFGARSYRVSKDMDAYKDLKIKDNAVIIKDVVGFKGDIIHDLTKPDGTPRKLLDISKIKELGWKPKVSLEEGIRKTYEWYLKRY